jgi:hypothetical protein
MGLKSISGHDIYVTFFKDIWDIHIECSLSSVMEDH